MVMFALIDANCLMALEIVTLKDFLTGAQSNLMSSGENHFADLDSVKYVKISEKVKILRSD